MEEVKKPSKSKTWWNNNSCVILSILFSLAFIALGVLFFVAPEMTGDILRYIIGGILILAGVIFFIVFFAKGRKEGGYQLVYSIPLLIVGIYMIIPSNQSNINDFLLTILGVLILIVALFSICKSIAYATLNPTKLVKQKDNPDKKEEKPNMFWLWILLSSCIVAGCGIAITFITDKAVNIMFVGGTLIFEGARRFLLSIIFSKSIKKCEATLRENKAKLAKEKEQKEKEKEQEQKELKK